MKDFRLYKPQIISAGWEKKLGAVFVSVPALTYFRSMVNGHGMLQLDDRLDLHALGNYGRVPDESDLREMGVWNDDVIESLHDVGDYLHIVTDRRRQRTLVRLSAEEWVPVDHHGRTSTELPGC